MSVVPLTPNTTVKVLQYVPLDNSYTDTLEFFSGVSDQFSYFSGKAKYTFTEITPIRMQNEMRLPTVADNLYDCNYIMFQNANFSQRWFYAFITDIKFINTNCCHVSFELDVMQTWRFNGYELQTSFVEREHVNDDSLWTNLVPEDLEHGEYIARNIQGTGRIFPMSTVVAATFDKNFNNVGGARYAGIFSGLVFNYGWGGGASELPAWLEQAATENKADGIVSIFMMPTAFISETGDVITLSNSYAKVSSDIDGYVPHNNKLFNYPYNFLYCTNMQGNSAEFQYEYFSGGTCDFHLVGSMCCTPEVTLIPQNYKGVTSNLNEKMSLSGFPQCAYATDSFRAWLAQHAGEGAINSISQSLNYGFSLAGSAGKALDGDIVGAAVGGAQATANFGLDIARTVNTLMVHSSMPPQARSAGGATAETAAGIKDFVFMNMTITAQFAKIIDGYFDMFGYKVNSLKIPNRTGRPSWNYVKTRGAKITGSVPFDDLAKIKTIFNNGITFWHGDYVGDYSHSNK